MTAVSVALGAAKDMEAVNAKTALMKSQLQALLANVSAALTDVQNAKQKLAGATQMVSGGRGRGQELQSIAGQSEVKLKAVQALAAALIEKTNDTGTHADHTKQEIERWAANIGQ